MLTYHTEYSIDLTVVEKEMPSVIPSAIKFIKKAGAHYFLGKLEFMTNAPNVEPTRQLITVRKCMPPMILKLSQINN
jgi:hypothetical protein